MGIIDGISNFLTKSKPHEGPVSPEQLADILKSDSTLKKEWYRLCPLLPVAHPCLPLWESLVNRELLDLRTVYLRIFDLWLDTADDKDPPNIYKLRNALDSLHFNNAKSKQSIKWTELKYNESIFILETLRKITSIQHPVKTEHISELKRGWFFLIKQAFQFGSIDLFRFIDWLSNNWILYSDRNFKERCWPSCEPRIYEGPRSSRGWMGGSL